MGPPPHAVVGTLRSADQARAAFAEPMPSPGPVPPWLAALARRVAEWDEHTRRMWMQLERTPVWRRAIGMGVAIGDTIRLQRQIRTRRIDQWLAGAAPADVATFERWRAAFFARCDAMGALATEGLVACDLAMPEDGIVAMATRNPARLGRMLGAQSAPWATASVYLALPWLVAREWDFVRHFVMRQLRHAGVPLTAWAAERKRARLNRLAGRTILTARHREPLVAAYGALAERGVRGEAADRLVLAALTAAEESSGKPWKGLVRLHESVVYSGLDPTSPDWDIAFLGVMTGAVEYTHVPGREWIVRDYSLGKRLMQMDGKVAPGDQWAALQQGRSSLATGYIRGGQDRTEFGRRYSKPLAAFLDSMVVAEGADHQRQRRAFIPFFAPAAVLGHASYVEATVRELLDDAAAVARANDGHFDIRTDFAYRFPVRVICRVLDLPREDVPSVQHWAEAAVRAMDTEAGITFETAIAGQRASDELRAYLEGKLAAARAGTFAGQVIRTVANDATLTEAERVANLGVIIFAGFETTTGLIAKGMETLLRHPAQWEHLREALIPASPVALDGVQLPDAEWRWLAWAEEQPDRTVDHVRRDRLRADRERSPAAARRFVAVREQEAVLDRAVEELLRWTAPGTVVPLTASKDVPVALETPQLVKGCPYAAGATLTIQRGETINVAVDELNRRCPVGPGRFAGSDPARFDATRSENTTHLSFGLRHSCIGAFLARENAKRAIEGLLRRFPDLELAGDPVPQEMELFSGLARLPVRSRTAAG